MRTIGLGIIGWGFMGRMHAYGAVNLPLYYDDPGFRVRLAAVCSKDRQKAARAQSDLGFAFSTGDYNELLARDDVDAVCVCTPNHLHEEIALAAVNAGKHIYMEKPLSYDGSSAGRMADALAAGGVLGQVVFNNRFYPATIRAKQLVSQGRIGRPLSFNARYLHSGSVGQRPAGWKHDGAFGGGVLLDLGSHAVDLVCWLLGDIHSVCCRTQTIYPERQYADGRQVSLVADDAAYVLATTKSRATGFIEATKIATGQCDSLRLEVYGQDGSIVFDTADCGALLFCDNTAPESDRGFVKIDCIGRYDPPGGAFPSWKNAIGFTRSHAHCLYSFLRAVAEGARPSPSFDEAAYVQRVLDACLASASKGESVCLDTHNG